MDNSSENDSDSSTSWVFVEKESTDTETKTNSEVATVPELTRETIEEVNAYFDCANSENQSESDISIITDSEGNCSFDEETEIDQPELKKLIEEDIEETISEELLKIEVKTQEKVQPKSVFNLFAIIGIVVIAYVAGQFFNNCNLSANMKTTKTKSYFFMHKSNEEELPIADSDIKMSYDYDDLATPEPTENENLADLAMNYHVQRNAQRKYITNNVEMNKNKIHRKRHDDNNRKKKIKINLDDQKVCKDDCQKSKEFKKKYYADNRLQTDGDDTSKKYKKYRGENVNAAKTEKPNKKWKKMEKYLTDKEKYLLMKEFRLWKNERRVKMLRNAINLKKENWQKARHFNKYNKYNGDWYLKLHKNRAKFREEESKADWLFDRARMRTKKRSF